jgi:hypothetical protein
VKKTIFHGSPLDQRGDFCFASRNPTGTFGTEIKGRPAIGAGYAGADTGEDESGGYKLKPIKYR